jgi:hypothetical protein
MAPVSQSTRCAGSFRNAVFKPRSQGNMNVALRPQERI